MTLKYINFCPYLKITRSGKIRHRCQSDNDQPEQGMSPLTSTRVSAQHMQHVSTTTIYPVI